MGWQWKKVMIAFAAFAMAMAAKAAVVDWQYTTTSTENGYTVYLFSSAVADSYESFADLTAGAIGSGTVASAKVGPRTYYYTPVGKVESAPDTLYYALIKDSDAKEYTYGSVSTAGFTYDPEKQQTSPGTLQIPAATESGKIESVPEPTSAMLLLLGVAGLALKRKQK